MDRARIDDSLDALAGRRIFSTLDLLSGYWQIPLDNEEQHRSTFVTRDCLYEWKRLSVGLTSAPACFSCIMERVRRGFHWKILLLYLKDMIVFSNEFSSHIQRLGDVFQWLRAAGLELKPGKCELFQR